MTETRNKNQTTADSASLAAGLRMVERLSVVMPKTVHACWLVLTAILLPVAAVVSYVGYLQYGRYGVAASAAAAVICWLAGMAALFVTAATRNTPSALSGILLSMLLRTGVPLLAAVVLSHTIRELAVAGLFGFFVVFYLLTLCLETLLSVGLVSAKSGSGEAT